MIFLLVGLLIFLCMGVPVAYSLGLAALVFLVFTDTSLIAVIPQQFLAGMNSYALISLPFFILMGFLMNKSGITERLIRVCLLFVGRLQGGLGLVNITVSMLFGGISGSSTSDTASIGSVLIPEMKSRGYPIHFASGITVASSTMGMLIPPSIPMVLYAVVAQESVGELFLAGLIPGLMVGIIQMAITMVIAKRRDYPREEVTPTLHDILRETLQSFPVFLMPIVVVGAVVRGLATATESAAIGVLCAIILGIFFFRTLTFAGVAKCLRSAALTSATIMTIIALSQVYIWMLAYERVPEKMGVFVNSLELSPIAILLLVDLIILLAGTFIDVSPAILLLAPVFLPILVEAGVSPVHFGVILISGLAVGACTPPVGNCLNVCSAISNLSIGKVFRGAMPFLVANVATLLLISFFPELVLWLPSVFMLT